MNDMNLGFFAKLFMDKLANKRQGTETKARPNKKTSSIKNKNQTHTTRRIPAPAGIITPYSLHPSQLIAFKQFEALRMQLLRQLVIYQKQLLALRMPMMPPLQQQMCPSHQSPFWPQYQENRASKQFGMNMTTMSQFGASDWTSKQSKRPQDNNRKPKRKTRKGASKKAKAKITVEKRQNRDESPSQTKTTVDFIQQPDKRFCDNEIGQTTIKPSVYPELDLSRPTEHCVYPEVDLSRPTEHCVYPEVDISMPTEHSRLSVANKLESYVREKLKGFTTDTFRDFEETKGIKSKATRVRKAVHNSNTNNIKPDCPEVLLNNKNWFPCNKAAQRFATVKRNGNNI